MRDVQARLRDARPPGEEHARRRAWAVSADAFAARETKRRRRWRGPLAVLLVGGVVATPAGSALADLAHDVVAGDEPAQRAPAPTATRPARVPGGAVLRGGSGLLRQWEGGAWSPHRRYVVAWEGRRLAAVVRGDGRVAWRLAAPAAVAGADWSPEGFHVAYLAGAQIRVVAGNGQRDRVVDPHAARVVPAFRPRTRRTLAYVRADGRIELRDVFTGAVQARSPARAARGARELAWTRGGGTLAIRTATSVRLWTPGRHLRTLHLDGRPRALAGGTTIAVLVRRAGESDVVALRPRRLLLRVRDRIDDVVFTPDGRQVVALWPDAGQWLLLDAAG